MRGWRSGGTARRWGPVAAWLVVISTLSSGWFGGEQTSRLLLPLLRWLFPSATLAELVLAHHLVRKLAHFAEFLVLGLLLYRALDGAAFSPRIALRALALAAAFAVGDELHQGFASGRTAAPWDCVIDTSGAAAGLALLAVRARGLRVRDPARS